MYWNSFAEFLAMGNHGAYDWGSAAVMALLMSLEPLLLVKGRKQRLGRLKRQLRAEKPETCADTPPYRKDTH